MAPKKKKIKDMTPEEAKALTDDEVIERVFNKKTLKELKKVIDQAEEKGKRKKE